MKVINMLVNGDNHLFLFGVDDNINGILAIYDQSGCLLSNISFSDYIDLSLFLEGLNLTAYVLFSREKALLEKYFNSIRKMDEYNRRIMIEEGISPVNIKLANLENHEGHKYVFGISDDVRYGILAVYNGSLLSKHYFKNFDDFIGFKSLMSEIEYCLLNKNKLRQFFDIQPNVPDSINMDLFLEYIQPINIRSMG